MFGFCLRMNEASAVPVGSLGVLPSCAKTIHFATTEISLMMNAGIQFEKTKKI
jgi:hypothetical protein